MAAQVAALELVLAVYLRFADFTALRDELGPQRRFGNAYLTAVLCA